MIGAARRLVVPFLLWLVVSALPAAGCALPEGQAGIRAQLAAAINAERRRAGLGALRPVAALDRAAQDHACRMARRGRVDHRGALGIAGLGWRLRAAGYAYATANENLAAGQTDPGRVAADWMASPRHRANLLSPAVRDLGTGMALGGDGWLYWVMIGAAPR